MPPDTAAKSAIQQVILERHRLSGLAGWLRDAGDLLRHRQTAVRTLQWLFVIIYLVLLLGPLLSSILPMQHARWDRIALWTEALFWGIWWPAVILSMMCFGQFWCGLFCPDGTLTEFASRFGRGQKVPAPIRWAALPVTLCTIVVLYEYIANARYTHTGTVLLLGTMSLAALATGFLYGRGKRVWCRYLCPTGGIFSLLARCSSLHFRVDRDRWDSAARQAAGAVDCPPLLDVRRLISNEKCNMCGRCSGHRDAVTLSWRPPGTEISTLKKEDIRSWEVLAILFLLIGLCHAGVYWQYTEWAVFLPTWPHFLRGLVLMISMALGLGSAIWLTLLATSRGNQKQAAYFVYGLLPLAGAGLFLGATQHSISLMSRLGMEIHASHIYSLRATVLASALIWSLTLGSRLSKQALQHADAGSPSAWLQVMAQTGYIVTVAGLAAVYFWAPMGAHVWR